MAMGQRKVSAQRSTTHVVLALLLSGCDYLHLDELRKILLVLFVLKDERHIVVVPNFYRELFG